jgi:hypothetical protein
MRVRVGRLPTRCFPELKGDADQQKNHRESPRGSPRLGAAPKGPNETSLPPHVAPHVGSHGAARWQTLDDCVDAAGNRRQLEDAITKQ